MSSEEFMRIATAINGLYPGVLEKDIQLSIWAKVAADIPAEIGEQFVIDWATTSKFPPTLADFNKYAVDKLVPRIADAGEAWEHAIKVVAKFGYGKEKEALATLDELTASVVKSMGYDSLCMSEITDHPTLRAQFRMIYEGRAKFKEQERMRNGVRMALLEADEQKKLGGGEQ